MQFDIVVVTYNSAGWLPGCVRALAATKYDHAQLHLIFVDNASSDDTVDVLRSLQNETIGFGGFSIVPQKHNKGFSSGCNRGAKIGNAGLLFFLNADTEVDANIFTELAHAIKLANESTAAFECRQLPFETGHHIDPVTLETSWASGSALVVYRSAFEQVGGFDEHLFMYCEDVDLSWRLRAAGHTIQYVPRAEVVHYAYDQSGHSAPTKLGEYTGGFYGNLLLRYKFGTIGDICRGHKMYWGALRQPVHFDGVRRILAKNYLRHFIKMWPFLFWRLGHNKLFRAKTARFEGGFSPDRGQFRLEKPATQPLISVVVRTCARPDMLRETLKSLQNQTYKNFEVVVVEDGFPTSKEMVEQEFMGLPLRYFATEKKLGRSKAGNFGLAKAKGEYLNFLDDDDYFYPDHLELMASVASNHPEADIILSNSMAMIVNIESKQPYRYQVVDTYPIKIDRLDVFTMCQNCQIANSSAVFKKSLYEQCGGLDEKLEAHEDWSMWLRFLAVAKRVNPKTVDIPRSTTLFTQPADRESRQQRMKDYMQFDQTFFKDSTIRFELSLADLRGFYDGTMADIRHVQNQGQLEEFLEKQASREKERE